MRNLENELFEKWRELFVTGFYKEFNRLETQIEPPTENIFLDGEYKTLIGQMYRLRPK